MSTPAEIAAKHGMKNAEQIVAAAVKAGLELPAALAMITKESGGRNVWGSDKGGVFSGRKTEVNEKDYREFRRRIDNGQTSNGCGVAQITYKGFFPLMEKRGLKPWVPYDNALFGFELIKGYRKTYGSWALAGVAYNAGPGLAAKGTVTAYGRSFAALVETWRERLADVPSPVPPTEEAPVARKTFRGKTFDARTAAMLAEVARRTKAYVQPTQGSYNNSVGASAGTHSGGGAVDLHCASLPEDQALEIVRVMREVGFAAWIRKPSEGNWPEHIHGIAIGCPDLSPSAKRQVTAYKAGLSGLASGRKDRHAGMGVKPTTWEAYLKRITDGAAPKVKVSLARLVAAAKADPKAAQGVAKHPADVRPVEAALKAEGLLDEKYASDGAYGSLTVAAYKAWQESKAGGGFTGKDADGIPGRQSLERLARKYGIEVTK